MNLTNLLVANLLSLSNLTFFLDRLITDGKYKTVLINFPDEPAIHDNDFFARMSELAVGKYSMYILIRKSTYATIELKPQPFQRRADLLHVILSNFGTNDGEKRLRQLLERDMWDCGLQNLVLLIPMQPDKGKKQFWDLINQWWGYFKSIKIAVIFYQTDMVNMSRKSLEIFVLNQEHMCGTQNNLYFCPMGVDVENGFGGKDAQLNEKIFKITPNLSVLYIQTSTVAEKYVSKLSVHRGNQTLINFVSAD